MQGQPFEVTLQMIIWSYTDLPTYPCYRGPALLISKPAVQILHHSHPLGAFHSTSFDRRAPTSSFGNLIPVVACTERWRSCFKADRLLCILLTTPLRHSSRRSSEIRILQYETANSQKFTQAYRCTYNTTTKVQVSLRFKFDKPWLLRQPQFSTS